MHLPYTHMQNPSFRSQVAGLFVLSTICEFTQIVNRETEAHRDSKPSEVTYKTLWKFIHTTIDQGRNSAKLQIRKFLLLPSSTLPSQCFADVRVISQSYTYELLRHTPFFFNKLQNTFDAPIAKRLFCSSSTFQCLKLRQNRSISAAAAARAAAIGTIVSSCTPSQVIGTTGKLRRSQVRIRQDLSISALIRALMIHSWIERHGSTRSKILRHGIPDVTFIWSNVAAIDQQSDVWPAAGITRGRITSNRRLIIDIMLHRSWHRIVPSNWQLQPARFSRSPPTFDLHSLHRGGVSKSYVLQNSRNRSA